MKATETQNAISRTISSIAQQWIKSNDITSASHYTLIDEDIDKLGRDTDLSEEQCEFLKEVMYEVYQRVKDNQ
jgi:hypothetical protein